MRPVLYFYALMLFIAVGLGIALALDYHDAIPRTGWSVARISIDYPDQNEHVLILVPAQDQWSRNDQVRGTCSGFPIGQNRVLTAAHCMKDAVSVWVDGVPATLLKTDDLYDLALLRTITKRPALLLRDSPVQRGEHLTAIGYAWGMNQLMFWDNIAKQVNAPALVDNLPSMPPGIIMQGEDIKGMSGGPVVDDWGYVVSMVREGRDGASYGVQVPHIRAFLLGLE